MSTLFDVTAKDPPDPGVVRALEGYGYKPDRVRGWSAARASATLTARRKDDAAVARRAAATAAAQEPAPERGQPTPMERLTAAKFLGECLAAGGPDDLSQAVAHTAYVLSDAETRQLAACMQRVLAEAKS